VRLWTNGVLTTAAEPENKKVQEQNRHVNLDRRHPGAREYMKSAKTNSDSNLLTPPNATSSRRPAPPKAPAAAPPAKHEKCENELRF
jgi:hypothetical protein